VVDEPVGRERIWAHREQAVRLVAAELSRQCAAQFQRVEDLGVHPFQERHVLYADGVGRRALLRLAECAVLVDVHVRVPRALLPAGHADVANVPSVAHPSGHGAGGTEVDVVRVGEDRESSSL